MKKEYLHLASSQISIFPIKFLYTQKVNKMELSSDKMKHFPTKDTGMHPYNIFSGSVNPQKFLQIQA